MSRSSYSGILFDLDGTLTDPKEGITGSIQYALRKQGIEAPRADALEHMIGPPLEQSFRRGFDMSAEQARIALADYRENFSERGIFQNQVYPGIPALLQRLRADGRKIALATSKPTVYAQRILEHFELAAHFDAVVGSFLDGRRVEKVEIVAEAVSQLAEAPAACVMVGDREHDIEGAHANGVDAVWVAWGYGASGRIDTCAPRHRVSGVDELGRVLELA